MQPGLPASDTASVPMNQQTLVRAREPEWLEAGALDAPPPARAWLTWNELLTDAVRHAAGEHFSFRCLGLSRERLARAERAALGVTGAEAWRREILMSAGRTPLLYGRTLIPAATLARHRWLAHLGDAPLGAALASARRPGERHGAFGFRRLAPGDPLLADAAPAADELLWARRSVIRVDAAALMIVEVFFPALLRLPPP